MRKLLLTLIGIYTFIAGSAQQQQPRLPTIRVAQYYIITERVYKRSLGTMNLDCREDLAYVNTISKAPPLYNAPKARAPQFMQRDFRVTDGDSIILRDTMPVIQSQYLIDTIVFKTKFRNSCVLVDGFGQLKFPVRYPLFDTTAVTNMSTSGEAYDVRVRMKVTPNNDMTYNLPTADSIDLSLEYYSGHHMKWLYRVMGLSDTGWRSLPQEWMHNIRFTGSMLFGGDSAMQYLNRNIMFMGVQYSGPHYSGVEVPSYPVIFTLRLSAPHIVDIDSVNLNCNGVNTGSIGVLFDRALRPGERLNILVKDTATETDFSQFNISSLGQFNYYVFPNVLSAGTFNVQLLGKFNNRYVLDTTITVRDTAVHEYIAGNSISFEEAFEANEGEYFEAKIDFNTSSDVTYTGAPTHEGYIQLYQPTPLQFHNVAVTKQVSCYGGNNGVITVSAKGSNGKYRFGVQKEGETGIRWRTFYDSSYSTVNSTPKSDTISGLSGGFYRIYMRDRKGCMVRDSLGNEAYVSILMPQPTRALTFDLFEVLPITSYDSTNGGLRIKVSGGTPSGLHEPSSSYALRFHRLAPTTATLDSFDVLMNSATDTARFERLNLPEGEYRITVFDANRVLVDTPYNFDGCFLQRTIILRKPDSLQSFVQVDRPITCHDSANAILRAKGLGGVRIDSINYRYRWFKEINNVFTDMNITDSVLSNIGPGKYKVEVKDRYNNIKLSQSFTVVNPEPITLALTADSTNCYFSADGAVHGVASGGTPPYYYHWSSGHNTPSVDSLAGGNYLLYVRDSFYCYATDTVSIYAPVMIHTTYSTQPVTCRDSCTGQITVTGATGGSAPYTYLWSTGATTQSITGLCAGDYWYKVYDANGCYDSVFVSLSNPDSLGLQLPSSRGICAGQRITLNAHVNYSSPLTYSWTKDNAVIATTDTVSVTTPGRYIARVTNNTGCFVIDTTDLYFVNDTIRPDFIVSSQAFSQQNAVLVNVSHPAPDSVAWILPQIPTVQYINSSNNFCEVIFHSAGEYRVGMKAFYASGCWDEIYKKVTVLDPQPFPNNPGDQGNAFLKRFVVFPNPNDGNFTVEMVFNGVTPAKLRLINLLSNAIIDVRSVSGQSTYTLSYSLSNTVFMPNQTYVLVIETMKGNFVYKVNKL